MKKLLSMLMAAVALTSCGGGASQTASDDTYFPKLTDAEVKAGVFTPTVMLKMNRIGEFQLSPDGKTLLYSSTVMDVENNTSYTRLYTMSSGGGESKMITSGNFKDGNARWFDNGKSIIFSSNRDEGGIFVISAEGGKPVAVTRTTKGDINGFDISPKGDMIWYTTQIKVDSTAADIYPELSKAKVRIYDDLMVRHWNYWLDGTYSHIHVAPFDGKTLSEGTDIMAGEAWDAPLAPYFDISEITWNNAGTQIAYTAKKLSGKAAAESTNSDIYIYDIATKKTRNLTEGMPGYDRYPSFSPDDKTIAWCSMERASNESDIERLFVINLESGAKTFLTPNFEYSAASIQWNDNNTIYFTAYKEGTSQVCRVKTDGASMVEVVTSGDHDYTGISLRAGNLVGAKTTLTMATELFNIDTANGKETQITFVNKPIYDVVKMASYQKRWIKTTDGKQMLTWVIVPPDFDSTKMYPSLLFCQGGPQSVVSQAWSYRWNFSLMASQGYVVIAPNRRGTPSFGREWLDQISGDYSGQNIKDYLSAVDDVSKEKWIDTSRRGCIGASYGGYSVYYLAGHHQKRFKTFISHCGMFNFESFYNSTEELWFPNNDLGGAPWSDNPTAKRSYANSPHLFVSQWNTPMLIFVGEMDYRIPYTESLQAFTAARSKNLEARIVVFEDEGHQVFKPQNATVWHSEFYRWLDKYLGAQTTL